MLINDNIRPYIVLNGVSSRSIKGLLISALAPISKPAQRVQQEQIDGRDGDIVTPLGFAAYDKVVKIGLTYEYDIDDIIEFFNSSGKVVFSNEPDKYYNYAIYNQIDFARLIRFKTAEVTFHVQPFKFSDVENARTFNISGSSEIQVRNNGNYFSRPTISISGFGIVNLYINGTQLLTLDLGNTRRTIIIDSTELNAYNEDKTLLLNRLVSGDYDNIRLKVGNNSITFTGSVFQVVIENYSRWI
jgi:predicted phage tail component-like protein